MLLHTSTQACICNPRVFLVARHRASHRSHRMGRADSELCSLLQIAAPEELITRPANIITACYALLTCMCAVRMCFRPAAHVTQAINGSTQQGTPPRSCQLRKLCLAAWAPLPSSRPYCVMFELWTGRHPDDRKTVLARIRSFVGRFRWVWMR